MVIGFYYWVIKLGLTLDYWNYDSNVALDYWKILY